MFLLDTSANPFYGTVQPPNTRSTNSQTICTAGGPMKWSLTILLKMRTNKDILPTTNAMVNQRSPFNLLNVFERTQSIELATSTSIGAYVMPKQVNNETISRSNNLPSLTENLTHFQHFSPRHPYQSSTPGIHLCIQLRLIQPITGRAIRPRIGKQG